MTDLEYIEKEIERLEYVFSQVSNPDFIEFGMENKMKHLLQIKAKLEAWEVVKENTIITEHRCDVDRIEMYKGGKGYEIFKKALEVE